MKDTICCIIVTYNCEEGIKETVASVIDQVDKVVIVDNGSSEKTVQLLKVIDENDKISLILCNENIGIAAALNKGVDYAINNKYKWILTMDHDSNLKSDMVSELLKGYYGLEAKEQENVVSLFPKYIEMAIDVDKQLKNNQSEIRYVDEGITSGNLVKCDAFKEVGYFDEKLFIDFVDFDFCYRLKEHGFKMIEVSNAILFHRLGEIEEVRFLHKIVKTSNHNALRKYYITRNRAYCWKRYKNVVPETMKKDKIATIRETIKIMLYEKDKFNKGKMIFKGYMDCKKERFGKYNDKK